MSCDILTKNLRGEKMNTITIYTTPTCPHCKNAKNFLKKQGIPFIEKDVSKNRQAQEELSKLGARGVPSFKIGDELVIGFNQSKILSLINFKIIECPNCQHKLRIPKNKGLLLITCNHCNSKFKVKS